MSALSIPSRFWNTTARYALAVFAASLVLSIRYLLSPLVQDRMPLLTYFAAVLLVAWHSGVGPAILTLILCVIGAVYWFIPPLHSFKIVEPSHGYSVLLLVLLSALVIAFCETHRRAKARLEATTRDLRQSRDLMEQRVEERTATLRMLSGRLLKLQDAERRRFSRELHDSAGQLLVALDLNLARLEKGAVPAHEMAQFTSETKAMVQDLLKEIRTLSYLLHPPLLDEAGLSAALRWYVERFAKGSNIEVELEISPNLERFPPEVETAAFRIVQESLTNVYRHSGSKTARVRAHRFNNTLIVIVEDQGHGMPTTKEFGGRGPVAVGLAGMRERAQQLGGTLEITSTEKGVTVRAVLPSALSQSLTSPGVAASA